MGIATCICHTKETDAYLRLSIQVTVVSSSSTRSPMRLPSHRQYATSISNATELFRTPVPGILGPVVGPAGEEGRPAPRRSSGGI